MLLVKMEANTTNVQTTAGIVHDRTITVDIVSNRITTGIVHDRTTTDTSNVLINGERVGTILQDVVMTNQDFTSYYNANIKKKQALLDTLIKMYEENHSVHP